MTEYIQVATTTDSQSAAQTIATALVDRRLAACVQISGPIESVYRWQGKVETAQEWHCTVKTRSSLFENVAQAIGELHSYDCPEIVATPLAHVSDEYGWWLDKQLG